MNIKIVQKPKEERNNDDHVTFLKKHIVTHKDNKPYVFISYASKDWYNVLHDIVYELVKRGLMFTSTQILKKYQKNG